MHDESSRMMGYFRDKYLKGCEDFTVLDVGSRLIKNLPLISYRNVFAGYKYTGMDVVEGINVDIVGYENIDKVYDVVVSGQTLEHVEYPWEFLKNLTKYFSKYICIIAPHTHREHKFPIDTFRYFPDGIRSLFKYAGIKEVEIMKAEIDTMGIGTK